MGTPLVPGMKLLSDRVFNDVFYVCSLIEYLSRETKNPHRVIIASLGEEGLYWLYEFADVHHCLSFENMFEDVQERYPISTGDYDVTIGLRYGLPHFRDIGKVYARLVQSILVEEEKWENPTATDVVQALLTVFTSFLCNEISHFNSDLFYDTPSFLYDCLKQGKICNDDDECDV